MVSVVVGVEDNWPSFMASCVPSLVQKGSICFKISVNAEWTHLSRLTVSSDHMEERNVFFY